MPRLKQCIKFFSRCKKVTHIILMAIGQYRATSLKTKTRILKRKKLLTLHPPTSIMMEVKASQIKLWAGLRKMFV